MIIKPFFSWGKPRLKYPVTLKNSEDIREVPLPETITLHLPRPYSEIDDQILKIGDKVKTGQKVGLNKVGDDYFISMATGSISNICEYTGYLSQSYTSISIKTEEEDTWDDDLKNTVQNITSKEAMEYLTALPGESELKSLTDLTTPLETIIINCIDNDLLVETNQVILKTKGEELKKGIEYLKKLANMDQIILLAPSGLKSDAEKVGIETLFINPVYPDFLSEMIMKRVFRKIVPAGKTSRDLGFAFINAEAVVALSNALENKKTAINKIITVIDKANETHLIKARIGTPIKNILEFLNISADHGDRLVTGGPMKGTSIYSEEIPISHNTDAIMVQDGEQIVPSSDIPCINCGECVRTCPANVPVNMLVRLLENGLYEEAAEEYDLLSCIECGLCSYVCVAHIPVFHFIMLGKYEFEKIRSMEESHA